MLASRGAQRWSGAAVAAMLALLTMVGCAGGSSDADATSPSESRAEGSTDGQDSAFPVTLGHRYGETTIEARPTRVVTVGLTDHDAALAVGVVPDGVTEWFGDHPSATWPWASDELGSARPEVVGTAGEIGFEKIAALDPDVILAVYSGLTDADYATLSQIAPTVAQPDEYVDYGVPWDEQTLIVGRALGEAARAEAAVAEVHDLFSEARTAHPEFEGVTGLVAVPNNGMIAVYAPEDVRGRFMASLGFVQPPEIEELAGDLFSADVSYERVDLIDVGALVWIVGDIVDDRPTIEGESFYAALDVHLGGHATYVENLSTTGGALSFQTVLSLPFLLEELVPQLATAVAGTPAA